MNTIGTPELRAWSPAPGVVWIQTRNPRHARRLAKRRHARRVAYSVAGPFLETFELRKSLRWAARLLARLTAASDTPPNGQLSCGRPAPVATTARFDLPEGSTQRADR